MITATVCNDICTNNTEKLANQFTVHKQNNHNKRTKYNKKTNKSKVSKYVRK